MAAKYLWNCWNIIYIYFFAENVSTLQNCIRIRIKLSFIYYNKCSFSFPTFALNLLKNTNKPQSPSVWMVLLPRCGVSPCVSSFAVLPADGQFEHSGGWWDSGGPFPRTRGGCVVHTLEGRGVYSPVSEGWKSFGITPRSAIRYRLQNGDLLSSSFHFATLLYFCKGELYLLSHIVILNSCRKITSST